MIACSATGSVFTSCGQSCAACCFACAAPDGPLTANLQIPSSFDFIADGSGELANAVWQAASAAVGVTAAGVVTAGAVVAAAADVVDELVADVGPALPPLDCDELELELLEPQPATSPAATVSTASDVESFVSMMSAPYSRAPTLLVSSWARIGLGDQSLTRLPEVERLVTVVRVVR
jgi:hypothetical protein